MKLVTGLYKKNDGTIKTIKVAVLMDSDKSYEGIELSKVEIDKIKIIQDTYNEKIKLETNENNKNIYLQEYKNSLKPYMSSYRKYNKVSFLRKEEKEI